jgi:hypothetical protein
MHACNLTILIQEDPCLSPGLVKVSKILSLKQDSTSGSMYLANRGRKIQVGGWLARAKLAEDTV